MDCLRWILSPCACCCPCQDGRSYLLRSRRSPLSVSTHDEDWDAEVGFESKIQSARQSAEMDNEMKVQMQQMSRNVTISMQNVTVTDEEESQHRGGSVLIETGTGQAKSGDSWRGYKSSALNTEDEDGFSSGSDQHNSGQNSPTSAISSNAATAAGFGSSSDGRKPYRDAPYSDKIPAGAKVKTSSVGINYDSASSLQAAHVGVLLAAVAAGPTSNKQQNTPPPPVTAVTAAGDDADADEDVEISLL